MTAPTLAEALRELELCANTVDRCYSHNPGNFAVALRELRDSAERARAALETDDAASAEPASVSVTDEMVEKACKRYAWREDGATFPDAYSEHEVRAERTLMREFLEHVLSTTQPAQPASFPPDWPNGPDREPPVQPTSVPDGWVMVPREPTVEMLRAEDEALPSREDEDTNPWAWGRASWAAFLAAAPQPTKENG